MAEEIKVNKFDDEEYRQTYWHSCSHVMAQAVKRLWPEVKLAVRPSRKAGITTCWLRSPLRRSTWKRSKRK